MYLGENTKKKENWKCNNNIENDPLHEIIKVRNCAMHISIKNVRICMHMT